MKKIILYIILLLSVMPTKADDLTDYQKQKVRQTVTQFCNLITHLAKSQENAEEENTELVKLCYTPNISICDDLNNRGENLTFDKYLFSISLNYNHSLIFSFKENINSTEVLGLMQPNLEKSTEFSYGQIELTKTIKGSGINKTVKNIFTVDLSNYRILGISSGTAKENPYDLWLMGMTAYNKKELQKALQYFEKCAEIPGTNRYVLHCQYATGIMYINKEGCKELKSRERDKRGLMWLRKSAKYSPLARQTLDRLGDY